MRYKGSFYYWTVAVAGVILSGLAVDVWAAEPASDTLLLRWFDVLRTSFSRATWDLLMRWVNFIILAVVILKFAKAPVVSFLREKRAQTALSIEQLENKKRDAEEKVRKSRIELEASQARLALIKERIAAEGKKRKAQIIEQAHQESRRLMEGARLKIDSRIREAYNAVRLEIIDMAAEKAAGKLPDMITEKDHADLVGQWMDAAQK